MTSALGFVELDHIWVDDRRTGRWAVRGLTLALEPATTVVLTGDDSAGHAVLDLLAGRRRPVRGRVAIDGIDLRDLERDELHEMITELVAVDDPAGERRVQIGRTTFVAAPRPCTQGSADLVLVLRDGEELDRIVSSRSPFVAA